MEVRLRPRFERVTTTALARVRERLQDAIAESNGALTGEVLGTHAQLMIGESRRHAWSPCLTLSFVRLDEERLRVRGLFGPHPALWTMIATLYAACAFAAFIGGVLGWSQWIAGDAPYGLWLIPGAAVAALILAAISISGQRLAHDEMHELAEVVNQALNLP